MSYKNPITPESQSPEILRRSQKDESRVQPCVELNIHQMVDFLGYCSSVSGRNQNLPARGVEAGGAHEVNRLMSAPTTLVSTGSPLKRWSWV